ncbi:zinc finger protein 585B-like [Lytechinus variegatus]|uniref:zinc finger protein 585B-like n=1 Tax=Lytechinus variegatus TaxID=7654 RepID=UPI001BB2C077|nr:zinc finger protein 585B-like [Lytechinus variegatus]XP_041471562.1 zinc finger protein 585B-like [Lytechinus variegatus]
MMKESLVSEKSGQNGTQLLRCFFCDASFYEEQDLSKHLQYHLQGSGVKELGLFHSHHEKLSNSEEVTQDSRSTSETPSMCQDSDGTRIYPSHVDHEEHRSNCTVETIGIQKDGMDISWASQSQKEEVVQMAKSEDQGETHYLLQLGEIENIQTGKFGDQADSSCHPQVEKEQRETFDQAHVSRHPGSEKSCTAETGETYQTDISCQSRSVKVQNSVRHHFQCEHCEEAFETQAKLIFHVTQMSAEKSYSCSKCGSEFLRKCLLLVHSASPCELKLDIKCEPLRDWSKSISKKEEHMDGQEWCCKRESEQPRQICGKSLGCSQSTLKSETSHTETKPQGSESGKGVVTEGNLKKHTVKKNLRSREKTKRVQAHAGFHQCLYCSKEFKRKCHLAEHILIHTGEMPFVCSLCGKGSRTKSNLNRHVKIMHPASSISHECPSCFKIFPSRPQLQRHLYLKHNKEKPFQCSECGRSFIKKGFFDKHICMKSNVKASGWSQDCSYCSKKFHCKSRFDDHVMMHTGERRFQCANCGKAFIKKAKFEKHTCRNTQGGNKDKKLHECSYCSKKFLRKCHLRRHVEIHLENSPFRCLKCGLKFVTKTDLDFHQCGVAVKKPLVHEKVHECSYCHKKFFRKAHLQEHVMVHTGERPFKCAHCGKGFITKCNLKRHTCRNPEKGQISQKYNKCSYCPKKFSRKAHLQEHVMIHTGERPFKCAHCGKGFITKCNLKRHTCRNPEKGQISQKYNKCSYCPKKFSRKAHLQEHVMIHTGERPFKCAHCGKGFITKCNFKRHSCKNPLKGQIPKKYYRYEGSFKKYVLKKPVSIHSENSACQCLKCGLEFPTNNDLDKHSCNTSGKSIHVPLVREKVHECSYCHKKFFCKAHLQEHVMIHTGERLYLCDKCGKGFCTKGNFKRHTCRIPEKKQIPQRHYRYEGSFKKFLKKHVSTHSENSAFQCLKCGLEFITNDDLDKHSCSTSGKSIPPVREKVHECSYCHKKFFRKTHLQEHIMIHTGERPFKCAYCGKGFITKCNFKRHTCKNPETGQISQKYYECSSCPSKFSRKADLQEHVMIHTGNRLYLCDKCGKGFRTKCNFKKHICRIPEKEQISQRYHIYEGSFKKFLKKHVSTHSENSAFQCLKCGLEFHTNNDLDKHSCSTSGKSIPPVREKVHECSYCHKKFYRKAHLQEHIMTHTGERPFKCAHCGKGFITKCNFKKHTCRGPEEEQISQNKL